MGALFRSEEMALAQLFIQPEAAYHVVAELGESGCVQFRDLNEEVNIFQREFAGEVKRCNEMERQLRYIESEIKKSTISISDIKELPKAPNPREIVNLEAHLEKTERDVRELTDGAITLKKEYMEIIQRKFVLVKAQTFFNQKEDVINDFSTEEIRNASQLGFLAGVINKEKIFAFESSLWRYGRGNIFVRQSDIEEPIEDPVTGKERRMTAFIAFYQGANLLSKIQKLCTGYKATLVDIPESLTERNEIIKHMTMEVQDIKTVINQTEDHRIRLLIAVAKDIQNWSVIVRKMKAIYHTLNLFSQDVTKRCLIAEGWIPTSDLNVVQKALTAGSVNCGSTVPSFLNILKSKETPPTYNRTNKFTQGFQNLISAYAFSTYRELNPALYTIITFPFLFAVMFGDMGHGSIMALYGAWMVISEKKILADKNKGEIFDIFFSGRYIILLMGIFSIYTGAIYNDLFSKSVNIFGSKWYIDQDAIPAEFLNYTDKDSSEKLLLIPRLNYKGEPYIFGIDPAWQSADNKIILLNSLKMKLSIIFGVVHMLFGITLSTVNFIHFKKYSHLFLEFLPKILFFCFLFLYLVIMISIKWFMFSGMNDGNDPNGILALWSFLFLYLVIIISIKWFMFSGMNDGYDPDDASSSPDTPHGSSCAPNVLIFFIGMMLFKKSDLEAPCKPYMFSGQEMLQQALVLGALLCIPVMLLGVPIHEMMSRKKKLKQKQLQLLVHKTNSRPSHIELETIPESSVLASQEEEEPMSSIMVNSAIHTIEFTLSTVSHTASYLRLWALSLAHAQLSDVLWTMIFRKALTLSMEYYGSIAIYLVFFIWASITIGILVLMEGLSAFLHTLRLHWVEFMTKFYEGEGYDFISFSFKTMLEEEEGQEYD